MVSYTCMDAWDWSWDAVAEMRWHLIIFIKETTLYFIYGDNDGFI